MDELKVYPYTRKEKMAVNNLKIDNGNGAYILKRDADVILHYIKFLQSEVDRLSAEPENKPLTLEQLRQMDGEPVWMVDGQGHEMYGIVNDTGCADADYGSWDADFYGMTGDGKHGLHIMGWIAYARKPEQEEK